MCLYSVQPVPVPMHAPDEGLTTPCQAATYAACSLAGMRPLGLTCKCVTCTMFVSAHKVQAVKRDLCIIKALCIYDESLCTQRLQLLQYE
jgi:hypothetical protein